jgi:lipopolysaccharide transport system ATP-binding protein
MTGDVVIRAEGLGKKYVIGHEAQRERYLALRDVLARGARDAWRKTADMLCGRTIVSGDTIEEFWALKDVSFAVERGEVLGIIGHNGAGKSTLLKILSRITEPSEGRVAIEGRAASLLEVGTGFHPELTGRENIYLNGAILGMTRAEIRRKFDEIVTFAEVEKFLDTPVKRYSSGMYVRLAFAVAAHLEPEVLIVDEVLAVGDGEFQKKCLGKIRSVSRESGRTVLFVSHNMQAVASLCGRAILMDGGRVCGIGNADEIINAYTSPATERLHEQVWQDITTAPGDDRVRVSRISIETEGGERLDCVEMSSPFNISIDYWNLIEGANLFLEVIFRTADGTPVFHSFSLDDEAVDGGPLKQGLYSAICHVPANLLNAGTHHIDISFQHGAMSRYFSLPNILMVDVRDTTRRQRTPYYGRYLGIVHPVLRWQNIGQPALTSGLSNRVQSSQLHSKDPGRSEAARRASRREG